MARHKAPDPDTLDSWQKFTANLFPSYDADPGYYAIQLAEITEAQKRRLAVAWTSFYQLGHAAKASEYEGAQFYHYLHSVYPTAQRGSERRHFRGEQGLRALTEWQAKFNHPEKMAWYICENSHSYSDVRKKTDTIRSYGDYFAWKWCDLAEVLYGTTIDFTGAEDRSPKVPQQGAKLIAPDFTVAQTYDMIAKRARAKGVRSPANLGREFGIGEAETVCCVYKQYRSGSYVYGSRLAKAVARLESVPSKTGRKLTEALLGVSPWTRDELKGILASL